MAKISVILPIYNVEPYLERCLQSLADQDWKNFEVIMVDDGSSDQCEKICDDWARKDSRFFVYHKENGGVSDARNFGMEKAAGEYISFVDSDDYVSTDYLSYLYELISSEPNCKMSACNHFVVRGTKFVPNSSLSGRSVLNRTNAFREVLYHGILDVSAWGKLYHRSVFDGLLFPKDKLYEDSYIFGDLILKTERIVFGGEAKYYYVQRCNSIVHSEYNAKTIQFIDAVDRLCEIALSVDRSLEQACVRRRSHAALSTLRYMEKCKGKDLILRDQLRASVLNSAEIVLSDSNTPTRDRLAIKTLKMGYVPFYFAWRLYGFLR